MGEFDLSLIREFRSRPAFYDRNSPRFKDKVYTAHEWQEISNKLGYDVSLLKDRMLQLRNRYNLEKRRLEQLRDEQPGKSAESPWPLYEQLQFLSEHIRARRSYKRMLPISMQGNVGAAAIASTSGVAAAAELSNSGSNLSSSGAAPFANGLLTVKMEDDSDVESDSQSAPEDIDGSFNPGDHPSMVAHAQLRDHHSFNLATDAMGGMGQTRQQMLGGAMPPSISLKRVDMLRDNAITTIPMASSTPQASSHHQQQSTKSVKRPSWSTRSNSTLHESDAAHAAKQRCLNARDQKYAAFGSFVSSSLLELPPRKALLLVEKFTSEVVKLLIQSEVGDTVLNGGGAGAGVGGAGVAAGIGGSSGILNEPDRHS